MIVVDGDSVAVVLKGVPPSADKWPYMLGRNRGLPVTSIAANKATARDCFLRQWKALALKPAWYVLCVGQWSQNHEPLDEFERNIRTIVEAMHLHGIRVCLMTPTVDLGGLAPYADAIRKCARIYQAGLLDLTLLLSRDVPDPAWWENDGTVRCHFSPVGAKRVIEYFDMPEHAHLCR